MKPKERVLAALEHKQSDRVPLFEIWIDEAMVVDLGYKDLQSTHVNLGLDCVMIPNLNPSQSNAWRDGVDEWGRVWSGGMYKDGVVNTEEDLLRYTPPLEYVDEFFDTQKIEEAKRLYPDYCLIYGSHLAPFTAAYLSMGFERFFIRLIEDPAFIQRLLEARFEWCMAMFQKAISYGIDVAVLGDDVAHKGGPMVSPNMWRELFLAYHRRIVEELDVPVIWHSDGDFTSLLPMAVEAGFAGVHGFEPGVGIDLNKIKQEFGQEFVLIGNVDTQVLCNDDLDAVRKEVKRCMEQGAPSGGYMFASCNSIFTGMNPVSVREMYRYALNLSSYGPI